ncbi:MAG: hypothetical protein GX781_03680 [Clostridiales bacterium]|nr:hypothetical protein [Clostridiales bacterium]
MLKIDNNSFWSRWLPFILGLAMLAGAWLVIAKTTASFAAVNIILGSIILIRGLAGLLRFYKNRGSSRFKEKAGLGLAVFLVIVGVFYLVVPGMMGDAIKWRAALAFAVIAARSLWVARSIAKSYPRLAKFSLVLNILLLGVCIVMVTLPFANLLVLAILIASALLMGGIDLLVWSLLPADT